MKKKTYLKEKDLIRARKTAPLYLVGFPFIYLYGLLENHFSPSYTFRGYNERFLHEYKSMPSVLFKGYYYDNSIEFRKKEVIRKAKKNGFKNTNIITKFYEKFSFTYCYTSSSTLEYHNDGGHYFYHFTIKQEGKDQFKIWYKDGSVSLYSPRRELTSDYLLDEQQVLYILDVFRKK